MMQSQNFLFHVILFFILALLFLLTPETKKFQGSFGIQIPLEHLRSKPLLNMKRLYRCGVIIAGLLIAAVNVIFARQFGQTAANMLMPILLAAYLACALAFFCLGRKAVKTLKERRGWKDASPSHASAAVPLDRSFTESRLAPSAWWLSAHLVLIAATGLVLYFTYPYMQGYLPTMLDFAGSPAGYIPKTPQLICVPVLLQLLVTLICAGAYSMVKNSRLYIDPTDAKSSLMRSRRFRVVWSAYLLALAFVLDLMILTAAQLLFLTPQLRYLTPYLMGGTLLVLLAITLWLGYTTSKFAGRRKK